MTKKFKYKALTSNGESVADYLYAADKQAALISLKQQSLIVISIDLESNSVISTKSRISSGDIEQSTNQLATLLENGLRINDALEVLVDTASSPALADVWRTVYNEVQSGSSLYNVLKKYPELFDVLYLEMTNIAENTGNLPTVFRSLAENLAFQRDLRSKTIQALLYPMIIFIVCVTAIFAIFNFVIPNMTSVFSSVKDLPGYTQWLLNASDFVSNNNFFILLTAFGVVTAIVILWQQEGTKQTFMAIIASLPLLGRMIEKSEQIRFCSAMSLTLQSGLSLSASLSLSIKTLTSNKNKQLLEQTLLRVDSGAPLAASLAASYFLDRISLSLIKVGEQSGTLDRSFIEVTRRAKGDFESWMIKLTALLEPLLIMIMGGIVGGVVVIMLLSIVSVNDLSL